MKTQEQLLAEHLQWKLECETPSTWEQIAYLATVAVASLCTLVVVFGVIGYLAGICK